MSDDRSQTHATLLLTRGVAITAVSERLGHSKTSVILDTCTHVLPDMQAWAVEALDAALLWASSYDSVVRRSR